MTRSPMHEARRAMPRPASFLIAAIGTMLRILDRFLAVTAKAVAPQPARLPARLDAISRPAHSADGERHRIRLGRTTPTPCAKNVPRTKPPPALSQTA